MPGLERDKVVHKLTADTVLACLQHNSTITVTAHGVIVKFAINNTLDRDQESRTTTRNEPGEETVPRIGTVRYDTAPWLCSVRVRLPTTEGKVVRVLLTEQTCTRPQNAVSVTDGLATETWMGCKTFFPPGFDFVSDSDQVLVTLEMHNEAESYVMRLMISEVDRPPADQLEAHFVTPHEGYIQTPRWDSEAGVAYPTFMDSTVNIDVPENHTLLLQLLYDDIKIPLRELSSSQYYGTDLYIDWFEVSVSYEGEKEKKVIFTRGRRLVWTAFLGKLNVFNARRLKGARQIHVQFHSDNTTSSSFIMSPRDREKVFQHHTGFRLLFQFYTVRA